MKRTPLERRTPLANGTKPLARKSRVAGTPPRGNPIPPANRAAVRERSGHMCEIRATPDCDLIATEQHHRQRRRDGGHGLANLLDACSSCHAWAHAHPQQARDRGWIVSAFAVDPALEPVRYGDPADRLVWFHDDGRKDTAHITPPRGPLT